MDEDLSLNAIPMVVRNDTLSESLAETVSSNLKQADEDAESNISGKCEESEHGEDDEPQSIENDAAFEIDNRETISPGDFDTYAIAYICKGHYICAEKSVEKAEGKPFQGAKPVPNSQNGHDKNAHSGNDIKTHARDPSPMYTHNNMNPYPMDAKNYVNPNPMYLQSTIEPNVSPGPTSDPNPIYPHNTINPYPMDARNDVNPNPMYLQTPVEPPNASPESTIRSYENDDIPCTQASADVHQQGDVANFRPANNDDNHGLQPYAVTHLQDGEANSSPANNDDNHCLQPYAVTHLQDGEANSSPANNDDNHGLQPYAVTHLQDGEANSSPANNDDNHCLQPYAVTHLQDGDANSSPANNDDNHCLQPYAVTHLQDEEAAAKASITSDDESIKPYATAYMCQDDMVCSTASGDDRTTPPLQNQPSAASNNIHDIPNALNPNPMYLPNVQHCPTCAEPRRLSLAVLYAAVVLGSCIVCGVFFWLRFGASPPPLNTTYGGIVSPVPTMPSPLYQLDAADSNDRKLKKVTLGGQGKRPNIKWAYDVAVSADNEIFVTDLFCRVHVFSIEGAYLRHFPTVLPGGKGTIEPCSVAIGAESGYVWVLGRRPGWFYGNTHVIQYSTGGQPMKTFSVHLAGPFCSVIAIDARNNKIIVGHGQNVMMFNPNGSLYRKFKVTNYRIGGIISDCEGNILLSLVNAYRIALMYSHSGDKIFEIGIGANRLPHYRGVCLDTLGRIIVANNGGNRIDMFTSRGEFLRTIAHVENPWGVAVGPNGDLVVTRAVSYHSTVTIFPCHLVLS
ncbi:hypothetical protein Bbelb_352060 [Branchiostoma belcheri]|nr:hypothetical protein Bbelb_352060 [Branchiostoma belcheri]